MRTGKALLLATRPFAVDDPLRSWWCVLSTLALVVIAWGGAVSGLPLIVRTAFGVAEGLFLLRLFVIYHDHQHHAILPHSKIAKVLMRLVGILLLSPNSIWTSSHNHHHNHNSRLRGSSIGSFPIMTTRQFQRTSRAGRFRYLFIRHPATILCGYLFVFIIGMCLQPFFNAPRKHLDSLIALILHAGIGIALLASGGVALLVLGLILPAFIACALGSYLFYAQHNFPGVTFETSDGWTYERAALDSSSYLVTGRFMSWVTGNIGYHHIHHLNARIPFYRLPEVMQALPELRTPRTTSLHPRDIFRCVRLKLWDADGQAMVPIPAGL